MPTPGRRSRTMAPMAVPSQRRRGFWLCNIWIWILDFVRFFFSPFLRLRKYSVKSAKAIHRCYLMCIYIYIIHTRRLRSLCLHGSFLLSTAHGTRHVDIWLIGPTYNFFHFPFQFGTMVPTAIWQVAKLTICNVQLLTYKFSKHEIALSWPTFS